ncbi:hypothetical protein E4U60_006393 [Claviceps pazoutovae]|uniref:Protein kinase domain-containing protein n=1 Tax=Claviceps pazoutovae TaxID=1649127 RepID=A0A9P7M6V4_9HYPO|nr:hypothetical protein E4U60_006393 [Claviceps pazoutovae]
MERLELEFGFTKIIIHRFRKSSEIDLDNLGKIPIDTDTVWPRYSARFLRAPSPASKGSYVKKTNLGSYEEFSDLVLHEIEAYELLRRHPHPNIVEYRGCVVSDGRITGICLAKYKMTLNDRMKVSTPFDKDRCLECIERGIRHLHSLGIVHNDLKPANIMLDELDRPGQKFAPGMKTGALEWSIDCSPYEYALCENDMFASSKLREFISREAPRRVNIRPLLRSLCELVHQ